MHQAATRLYTTTAHAPNFYHNGPLIQFLQPELNKQLLSVWEASIIAGEVLFA